VDFCKDLPKDSDFDKIPIFSWNKSVPISSFINFSSDSLEKKIKTQINS